MDNIPQSSLKAKVHSPNWAYLIEEKSPCIKAPSMLYLHPPPPPFHKEIHAHTPLATPFRHSLVAHLNAVLHQASAIPTKTRRNKSHQGVQHFAGSPPTPPHPFLPFQSSRDPEPTNTAKHRKLSRTFQSLTAISNNVGISRAESRKYIKLYLLHMWSDAGAAGKQQEEDVTESWKGEGGGGGAESCDVEIRI